MRRKFLGDSFDAAKRLWQEVFSEWAPLLADPRFIPNEIRSDFTRIKRIPILDDLPPSVFSSFNDPDAGIRLATPRRAGNLKRDNIPWTRQLIRTTS